MFEEASRSKIRFETDKGLVTVEDLWDIPLEAPNGELSLDTLAINIDRQLKTASSESFVRKGSRKNRVLELCFNIVKHIIEVKLQERDSATKKAVSKTRIEEISRIISRKKDAELENKSIEDLEKMSSDLEGNN